MKFTQDKETPGTIRYAADDDESAVRTIYMRKAEGLKLGQRIVVEIRKGIDAVGCA